MGSSSSWCSGLFDFFFSGNLKDKEKRNQNHLLLISSDMIRSADMSQTSLQNVFITFFILSVGVSSGIDQVFEALHQDDLVSVLFPLHESLPYRGDGVCVPVESGICVVWSIEAPGRVPHDKVVPEEGQTRCDSIFFINIVIILLLMLYVIGLAYMRLKFEFEFVILLYCFDWHINAVIIQSLPTVSHLFKSP